MLTPKWLSVAKNEYRIHTSSIRGIRSYFPYLAIGLLAVYVVYVAPAIVNLFIDDFLAVILSQAAVAIAEIILFMIFVYFLIFPISNMLMDIHAGRREIFLAAPI